MEQLKLDTPDIMEATRYRVKCRRAKEKGSILYKGVVYEINELGKYNWDLKVPEFEDEFDSLMSQL